MAICARRRFKRIRSGAARWLCLHPNAISGSISLRRAVLCFKKQRDGQTDEGDCITSRAYAASKAEIPREQFPRSILTVNVTTMSLTCYEEIGCVGLGRVTRMLYEETAFVECRLNRSVNGAGVQRV